MPVIDHIDGSTRRIYLAAGVSSFHPIDDLYREYKALRQSDESLRPFDPFMKAVGNEPKGGGKYTTRFLKLLGGTKIVPAGSVTCVGEVITDDASDPFDLTTLTGPIQVKYQPAEAEVIRVIAGGNEYTLEQIADAIWSRQVSTMNVEGSVGQWVSKKLLTVVKFLGLK